MMVSESAALKSTKIKQGNDPEFEKGQCLFNQIKDYLEQNGVPFKVKSDKCISHVNSNQERIFIRFYFNQFGMGWGDRPAYSVGVYKDRKTSVAILGDDGKTLLITSNRGINGFEDRFTRYMSEFTGRSLKPLEFTHS